jgi:hypothetical protein
MAKVEGLGVVPVLITGNMSSPKVVPDVAALAKANASGIVGAALGQKSGTAGGILAGVLQGLGQAAKKKPQ